MFVRSLGCELCLEWTEPLAPQKSCLLGKKYKVISLVFHYRSLQVVCFGSWFCDNLAPSFVFSSFTVPPPLPLPPVCLCCSLSCSLSVFVSFSFSCECQALSQAQSGVRGDYGRQASGEATRLGQSPSASVCFLALSRRSAILEFLLLLLAAAATAAAAEAESASDAIGSPKGGGGNIR